MGDMNSRFFVQKTLRMSSRQWVSHSFIEELLVGSLSHDLSIKTVNCFRLSIILRRHDFRNV